MAVGCDVWGRAGISGHTFPLTPNAARIHFVVQSSDADVRARGEAQVRRAAVAAEAFWDDDKRATNPGRTPGGERRGHGKNETPQEIEGEQFEEERGVIGGEVGRRDLADASRICG
jgi:hypothetical protein